MFSFFLFVSFYHWFSLLFLLPFHVFCLCLFLCSSSRSLSLYPSTVSLSSFLTFLQLLGSLFIFGFFSFHFSSSFPLLLLLPSPPPSFSYLSLLLFVPVVGYSSFSSPSFSPSFSNFLFPFGSACLSVASSFSFPAISLFLVRLRFFPCPFFSTSCWLFFLLV